MIAHFIIVFFLIFFGVFLLLQSDWVRTLIGILIFGNAVNMIIFYFTDLVKTAEPIIPKNEIFLTLPVSDPLPQALILTAIVIGFGTIVFLSILTIKTHSKMQNDKLVDFTKPKEMKK